MTCKPCLTCRARVNFQWPDDVLDFLNFIQVGCFHFSRKPKHPQTSIACGIKCSSKFIALNLKVDHRGQHHLRLEYMIPDFDDFGKLVWCCSLAALNFGKMRNPCWHVESHLKIQDFFKHESIQHLIYKLERFMLHIAYGVFARIDHVPHVHSMFIQSMLETTKTQRVDLDGFLIEVKIIPSDTLAWYGYSGLFLVHTLKSRSTTYGNLDPTDGPNWTQTLKICLKKCAIFEHCIFLLNVTLLKYVDKKHNLSYSLSIFLKHSRAQAVKR